MALGTHLDMAKDAALRAERLDDEPTAKYVAVQTATQLSIMHSLLSIAYSLDTIKEKVRR